MTLRGNRLKLAHNLLRNPLEGSGLGFRSFGGRSGGRQSRGKRGEIGARKVPSSTIPHLAIRRIARGQIGGSSRLSGPGVFKWLWQAGRRSNELTANAVPLAFSCPLLIGAWRRRSEGREAGLRPRTVGDCGQDHADLDAAGREPERG